MRLRILAALGSSVLAGCSPQPSNGVSLANAPGAPEAPASVHPESGLSVVPLTIEHGGRRHAFRVEVARSSMEQARGLMFRTQMGADEGMIFPMQPPRLASFWMKNTVLPLDIVFIGEDHRILNIADHARPYDETPLTSNGFVIAVLELNAGRTQELGIAPGDEVSW